MLDQRVQASVSEYAGLVSQAWDPLVMKAGIQTVRIRL